MGLWSKVKSYFPVHVEITPAAQVETAGGWAQEWLSGGPGHSQLVTGLYASDSERAMKVSALSACVRIISGNTAKLPLHVFRRNGEDRERERDHPLERLLNHQPNRWQTAFEFRRQMTANVALTGNAFARKEFQGARISALIHMEPERVKIVPGAWGEPPTYEFTPKNEPRRTYEAAEVFHLRDLTLDGITGLSRIDQMRQGINLSYNAEMFGSAYFQNGAEPGVGIEVEGKLDPDQRKALLESWKKTHAGPNKAHAPFVMEGGAKLSRMGQSNRESQFLELRGFQVSDIARGYGMPPHMIGLTEKQTSWGTGIESMKMGFLQFHMLDWLMMWESAIGRDLIVEDDVFMEHLVDAFLRADFKSRMEGYQLGIQNGILSPNEARKKENWKPRTDPGGDEYWKPSNMAGGEETESPKPKEVPAAATFIADRPQHAWRAKILAAQRAVASPERNGNGSTIH